MTHPLVTLPSPSTNKYFLLLVTPAVAVKPWPASTSGPHRNSRRSNQCSYPISGNFGTKAGSLISKCVAAHQDFPVSCVILQYTTTLFSFYKCIFFSHYQGRESLYNVYHHSAFRGFMFSPFCINWFFYIYINSQS